MEKIMEIRNIRTLQLLDSKEITHYRTYKKMCKRLTKIVKRHDKDKRKMGEDTEYLIRVRKNSFIIKSDNFGYVVGLKKPTSRWL